MRPYNNTTHNIENGKLKFRIGVSIIDTVLSLEIITLDAKSVNVRKRKLKSK